MNKKNIIVILSVVVGVIFFVTIFSVIGYYRSNKFIYKSIKAKAVNSGYANNKALEDCDSSFNEACIPYLFRIIDASIDDEQTSLGIIDPLPKNKMVEASVQLEVRDYKQAKKTIEEAIKAETAAAVAGKKTRSDIEDTAKSRLSGSGFTTSEYQIRSDWAYISIAKAKQDDAIFVLKKENDKWNIVFGPGTYIDMVDLYAAGVSEEIIDIVQSGVTKETDNIYF